MTLPLDEAPWTPSLLTRTARRVVEGNLGAIWVRGEVSDLKVYQSEHCYFALRDAAAQLRCVMWRANASRLKTTPSNGTQVFVFGTPTVWEEKGEFRLTVTQLLATEELGGQPLVSLGLLQRDPGRHRGALGQSITDACLSFDQTVPLLERLAKARASRARPPRGRERPPIPR